MRSKTVLITREKVSTAQIPGNPVNKKFLEAFTKSRKRYILHTLVLKLGDQDKSWVPHVACSVCVEELRQWFQVQGFNLKNRKDISYPTIIRAASRHVPHGPHLPIPSPPDTLDNILDDLDQKVSHISSNSDDGYDPGTDEPEIFSQSDFNDLVRDLGLPKDTAEVLGSRLKERHLLNSGVSFSWYIFIEKEIVPFYARGGASFLQQCTCYFGNVQNYV
ncbi:uncharacterized protein TNCV_2201211 [Trichonephila clavipes]|uniref:Uncharacterized protein n=1 Tax=Trichonephila clavipes TaxID=2585209 RepID=A0A8X6SQ82_TRICX|nr:uncharacterized protein TNCV_2201211 [Trichonephila clavipes]